MFGNKKGAAKHSRKTLIIGIIIALAIVVGVAYALVSVSYKAENGDKDDHLVGKVVMENGQIFDARSKEVRENVLSGDFQWKNDGFRVSDELGKIYNYWTVNYNRAGNLIHKSIQAKVSEESLGSVSKEDCENAKYGIGKDVTAYQDITKIWKDTHYSTTIKKGDVICISVDENIDGKFGDLIYAIKIVDFRLSSDGKIVESISFDYNKL